MSTKGEDKMIAKDTIQIHGHVYGELRDENGNLKERFDQENLILTVGKDNINYLLRGATDVPLKLGYPLTHIGIGWAEPDSEPADPLITDINMPIAGGTPVWVGGYQDRKAAVITRLTALTFKLVQTWGSGEPSTTVNWPKAIRCVGAFTAAGVADNTIFSWSKRAAVNKASADTLMFTYIFTIG